MSTVLRGMYIEKARQAGALLAEIVGVPGHDNMDKIVDPYRDVLLKAHQALMEIQNQMRKQP